MRGKRSAFDAGQGRVPPRGERVLFVDDEPSLTDVTRRMLERLGYKVVAHASATDALAAFRADPSAFDLAISDLTRHARHDGRAVALEMRRVRANVPVILSTGYLDRLDADTARALHARERSSSRTRRKISRRRCVGRSPTLPPND